jgi:hypothetical protein
MSKLDAEPAFDSGLDKSFFDEFLEGVCGSIPVAIHALGKVTYRQDYPAIILAVVTSVDLNKCSAGRRGQ